MNKWSGLPGEVPFSIKSHAESSVLYDFPGEIPLPVFPEKHSDYLAIPSGEKTR